MRKMAIGFIICFLMNFFAAAQNEQLDSEPAPPDTSESSDEIKYPIPSADQYPFSNSGIQSPLYLNNPSNIKSSVEYDPETNSYIFSEKVGSLNYRPSTVMTFKEFRQYEQEVAKREYWSQRAREHTSGQSSSLLGKKIRVGETFDKVFGSDAINIVPQGSAELIFGYNISRNDNPQISERNRKHGAFTFKEKIQMNVTGSIGDKMELGINFDTEATFDFENKVKLEYTGKEDEIIKKIEAGNVTFPLTGTLISGSQSLFGFKTELQFGKLTVTSVISQQKGESEVINVEGGAQINEFEVTIDDYDANRHFFLSHFFRDNYNQWLQNLPYITSGVRIEQIEVYITNKTNDFTANNNNIIAFMDLGEGYGPPSRPGGLPEPNFNGTPMFISPGNMVNMPVSNDANALYGTMASTYSAIRNFDLIATTLAPLENSYNFVSGVDYEKIESARRLTEREYTVNRELGYISLNSALRNDEILAVAYVYTYRGKTYRVGELSIDGIEYPNTLFLKLLKGTSLTPKYANWDLMMKNIYSLGAYQVNPQDFKLDILYRNDETGVPVNYIFEPGSSPEFNNRILLKVLQLDSLDTRNEPNPDGVFDFIEGITINSNNGKVIFPLVEPFGSDLRRIIVGDDLDDPVRNRIADKYVFEELYDSTQTKAKQIAEKNKFFIAGTYQSSSGSEIQLNAMNVPQGSVKVSAGGIQLVENQDYTVDYTLGRVKIINPGLLESGTPLRISLENNALFALQTKTLLGTHLDYRFSENFNVGGTIMKLTERPLTQKVNIGDEPISNTMWGLNTSYRTESNFLTSLIDKLPLIETKEVSSISIDAEFAHLIPGQSKAIGKRGVAYIDDFEGTETSIELKNREAWVLASTPKSRSESSFINDPRYNFGRAKIAWYYIDQLFTTKDSRTPDHIDINRTSNDNYVRQVYEDEIYKEKQSGIGVIPPISVLNLAYFPKEKGPYNYDPSLTPEGDLTSPDQRWGGIMREITTSDFESANVGYIEFWLMDPFFEDSLTGANRSGDLFFNLGDVSEDILRDSKKSFENGLPTSDTTKGVTETAWGLVPSGQSYTPTFSTASSDTRQYQDVGLDGLNDEDEREFFAPYLNSLPANLRDRFSEDPSGDNFTYYRAGIYDENQTGVVGRYKDYNGLEGNSPSSEQTGGDFAAESNTPDVEDINRDNTLNENESYYSYRVELDRERMNVGENYVVAKIAGKNVDWYQFRIPITDYENKFGNIEDFKSIRFMRMFLTGFQDSVILRFAELRLVRNEWRKYEFDVNQGGPSVTQQYEPASFEISAVNIEENSDRYVLPPGISRVIDPSQPQLAELNEQSMTMKVYNLKDGEARVAYKNTELDLRQYGKMTMWVHAEPLPGETLDTNDLTAFIRIGSDYKDNFYEYEIPLRVSANDVKYDNGSESDREQVWPNKIEINLDDFVEIKKMRDLAIEQNNVLYNKERIYTNGRFRVRGTPNLSNVRTIMLGVRNPSNSESTYENDGLPHSAEIWFNELRLEEFNNKGGWAANARVQAKLADVGTLSVAGSTIQPGFGSIEQKVNEREKEQINQIDISSNIELGKLFPEKSKVSVPMFFGISKSIINPEYYPKEPDRLLKEVLYEADTRAEKKEIKKISQDRTDRMSINFTNVRVGKELKKFKVLSPSNLSLNVGYSEMRSSNYNLDYNNIIKYNAGINYNLLMRPKSITPLKKAKGMKSPYFRIIKDFNFTLHPSRFTFRTDFDRYYNEIKLRNVTGYDIKIDSTINKDFVWNRFYDVQWDLTRSIKFTYTINSLSRIDEPDGAYDLFKEEGREHWRDSVWENITRLGKQSSYSHDVSLSYTLPINKIPLFNWLSSSARYGGKYTWNRGPYYKGENSLGHNLSNSNTIQLTGQVNMGTLYNKVGFIKRIDSKYKSAGNKKDEEKKYKTVNFSRNTFFKAGDSKNIVHKLGTEDIVIRVTDDQGNELAVKTEIVDENKISITADQDLTGVTVDIEGQIEKGPNPLIFFAENSVRFITGLKNLNITYSNSGGTMFLGYMEETNYFGADRSSGGPGFPFLIGWQDKDFMREAAQRNWLTRNQDLSTPYTMTNTETVNLRGTFEPYRGLRVDLTGTRSYTETSSEYFLWNSTSGSYNFSNYILNGNFSISVISIGSAFEKITIKNNYNSKAFNRFKAYRSIISSRLYSERIQAGTIGVQTSITQDVETGYSDGYNSVSPEVLVPAFLAAYTGKNPEHISLEKFPGILDIMPNWRISFDGLSRINFLKQFFKTINLTHSYQSTYNVGSFTNFVDMEFAQDGLTYIRDIQNNYYPELLFNAVSINEKLNPLTGIDLTWNNSLSTRFEVASSRLLALTLSNNQLTETRTNDYTVGVGYRFKELIIKINEKSYKSDLNLRLDFTLRDNKTLLRNLSPQLNESEASPLIVQKNIKFGLTADYALSERFNIQFFVDHSRNTGISKPLTADTNIGFSLRFTLN